MSTTSYVKLPPLKPMSNKEIRKVLVTAREHAADHWIQGTLGYINQKACALGVISEAQLMELTTDHTGAQIPAPRKDDPVVNTLANAIPLQFKQSIVKHYNKAYAETKTVESYMPAADWIVEYNDLDGRTKKTILRWFDRAIFSTYSPRHQKRLREQKKLVTA